jgi:hypothetical protein
MVGANKFEGDGQNVVAEAAYTVRRNDRVSLPESPSPNIRIFGSKHPIDARAKLRGRENIIMTEWGPWDHVRPLER